MISYSLAQFLEFGLGQCIAQMVAAQIFNNGMERRSQVFMER
jgi:hypothetical protein